MSTEQRSASRFRAVLWSVISTLNPNEDKLLFSAHDPQLSLRNEHFRLLLPDFRQDAAAEVGKAARSMNLCQVAIGELESIKALRSQEASLRWRASYDLALAQ
ncbi:MAG: hypothetical protein ACKPHU_06595, partial [Planctomycetaceae bacterium]